MKRRKTAVAAVAATHHHTYTDAVASRSSTVQHVASLTVFGDVQGLKVRLKMRQNMVKNHFVNRISHKTARESFTKFTYFSAAENKDTLQD